MVYLSKRKKRRLSIIPEAVFGYYFLRGVKLSTNIMLPTLVQCLNLKNVVRMRPENLSTLWQAVGWCSQREKDLLSDASRNIEIGENASDIKAESTEYYINCEISE